MMGRTLGSGSRRLNRQKKDKMPKQESDLKKLIQYIIVFFKYIKIINKQHLFVIIIGESE